MMPSAHRDRDLMVNPGPVCRHNRGGWGTPENRMAPHLAPIKTPAGQEELSHRVRRLSQRHRTVLLLVDGRRSQTQVLQLAEQAGVPESCFGELVAMGLIELPAALEAEDGIAHVDLPIGSSLPAPVSDSQMESSMLPPTASLLPESGWVGLETPEGVDRPLEEAREILLRALRNEAPVTGRLTMLKLKRAATRAELEDLLEEVEQRIRKPRKMIVTAQTLRHVRHLLSLPTPAGDGMKA
jgi:hypothetical protein